MPEALRSTLHDVYDVTGDPFAFPANAMFAIRHHVSLQRWDTIVGDYPFIPPLATLDDDAFWAQRGFLSPDEPYIEDGFGTAHYLDWFAYDDYTYRWTTAPVARMFVPNLMPYGQRLTLWLAPGGAHHAILRWNGDVVQDVELVRGWNQVQFDLPDISLHTNELTIEAVSGAPDQRVGVAVGGLELAFLPPN
jgi:hypothetical protein